MYPIKSGEIVTSPQIPGNHIKGSSLLCLILLLSPCGKKDYDTPEDQVYCLPSQSTFTQHPPGAELVIRSAFKKIEDTFFSRGIYKVNEDILSALSEPSNCSGRVSGFRGLLLHWGKETSTHKSNLRIYR